MQELTILTAYSKTHGNISVLFPKEFRCSHYVVLFGSYISGFCKHAQKFQWLVKRMSYTEADSCCLNPGAVRLSYFSIEFLLPAQKHLILSSVLCSKLFRCIETMIHIWNIFLWFVPSSSFILCNTGSGYLNVHSLLHVNLFQLYFKVMQRV